MFLPRRNCYTRLVKYFLFKIEMFLPRRNCYLRLVGYFSKADSNKRCRISAHPSPLSAPKLPKMQGHFLLRNRPSFWLDIGDSHCSPPKIGLSEGGQNQPISTKIDFPACDPLRADDRRSSPAISRVYRPSVDRDPAIGAIGL